MLALILKLLGIMLWTLIYSFILLLLTYPIYLSPLLGFLKKDIKLHIEFKNHFHIKNISFHKRLSYLSFKGIFFYLSSLKISKQKGELKFLVEFGDLRIRMPKENIDIDYYQNSIFGKKGADLEKSLAYNLILLLGFYRHEFKNTKAKVFRKGKEKKKYLRSSDKLKIKLAFKQIIKKMIKNFIQILVMNCISIKIKSLSFEFDDLNKNDEELLKGPERDDINLVYGIRGNKEKWSWDEIDELKRKNLTKNLKKSYCSYQLYFESENRTRDMQYRFKDIEINMVHTLTEEFMVSCLSSYCEINYWPRTENPKKILFANCNILKLEIKIPMMLNPTLAYINTQVLLHLDDSTFRFRQDGMERYFEFLWRTRLYNNIKKIVKKQKFPIETQARAKPRFESVYSLPVGQGYDKIDSDKVRSSLVPGLPKRTRFFFRKTKWRIWIKKSELEIITKEKKHKDKIVVRTFFYTKGCRL